MTIGTREAGVGGSHVEHTWDTFVPVMLKVVSGRSVHLRFFQNLISNRGISYNIVQRNVSGMSMVPCPDAAANLLCALPELMISPESVG